MAGVAHHLREHKRIFHVRVAKGAVHKRPVRAQVQAGIPGLLARIVSVVGRELNEHHPRPGGRIEGKHLAQLLKVVARVDLNAQLVAKMACIQDFAGRVAVVGWDDVPELSAGSRLDDQVMIVVRGLCRAQGQRQIKTNKCAWEHFSLPDYFYSYCACLKTAPVRGVFEKTSPSAAAQSQTLGSNGNPRFLQPSKNVSPALDAAVSSAHRLKSFCFLNANCQQQMSPATG